ncbi:MAG: hypothetical protein ACTSRG_13010 [Candidatus Helarchaeota archaeon]
MTKELKLNFREKLIIRTISGTISGIVILGVVAIFSGYSKNFASADTTRGMNKETNEKIEKVDKRVIVLETNYINILKELKTINEKVSK